MTTTLLERLHGVLDDVRDRLGDVADGRVIAAIVAGVGLLLIVRMLAVRSALRSRVSWAVLPSDEFDPSPEDVTRFAFELVRVWGAIRGWLARPASAVRIRLASVPDGQMLFVIEGPRHALSVLRAAMYDRVELRDLDELDQIGSSAPLDVPDETGPVDDIDEGRPVRGEPPEPDDPREDLEHDWLKEDR